LTLVTYDIVLVDVVALLESVTDLLNTVRGDPNTVTTVITCTSSSEQSAAR